MKYVVAMSLWLNAANAISISNLKVATETGSGLPQLIVAVTTAMFAIYIAFSKKIG